MRFRLGEFIAFEWCLKHKSCHFDLSLAWEENDLFSIYFFPVPFNGHFSVDNEHPSIHNVKIYGSKERGWKHS